jgi:hypothetical protein
MPAGIGPDLVRLLPDLRSRLGGVEPVAVPDSLIPAVSSTPFGRSSRGRLGSGRSSLVFEDLHWADASSLDLIGYLVRNASGRARSSRRTAAMSSIGGHPLLPWLAEIARVRVVERIELERLTPATAPPRSRRSSVRRRTRPGRRDRPTGRRQRLHHRGAARVARPRRRDPARGRHQAAAGRARRVAVRSDARRGRGDVRVAELDGRGRRRRGHGNAGTRR